MMKFLICRSENMDDLQKAWTEIFGHKSYCRWYYKNSCLMSELKYGKTFMFFPCSGICKDYEDYRVIK